jgi:hypothetical protein
MVPANGREGWGLAEGDGGTVELGEERLLVAETLGADALRGVPQAARRMMAAARTRLMFHLTIERLPLLRSGGGQAAGSSIQSHVQRHVKLCD